jgi:hypothetical protein
MKVKLDVLIDDDVGDEGLAFLNRLNYWLNRQPNLDRFRVETRTSDNLRFVFREKIKEATA